MTFSAAVFAYVVGTSVCLISVVNLSGVLAARLAGVSRLGLACHNREPGSVVRHLGDLATCNYIDFATGLLVLATFPYIVRIMRVVQGLSPWKSAVALVLASLTQFPVAIVLGLSARGVRLGLAWMFL